MGESLPRLTPAEIAAAIEENRREPFKEILGDFVNNAPDGPSVAEFAKKAPDRWMQATTMAAKLAGYNDKVEITGTIQHLHQLSDADLLRRLRELEATNAEIIIE